MFAAVTDLDLSFEWFLVNIKCYIFLDNFLTYQDNFFTFNIVLK